MTKMKIFLFLLVFFMISSFLISIPGEKSRFSNGVNIELAMDSWERRYYSPYFSFNWNTPGWNAFLDLKYNQVSDGRLKGVIDFWIYAGIKKNIKENWLVETSLNHLCRHQTSMETRSVFDLNEVMARVWYRTKHIQLGLGAGGYIGKNPDYHNLMVVNGSLIDLFETDLSLKLELKWTNWQTLLYEIEGGFSLDKERAVDLFVRFFKHYELEKSTVIGIRIKSQGRINEYIASVKNIYQIYPYYEDYKMICEGEFGLQFFKSAHRRLLFTTLFRAPIWRQGNFFSSFRPANIEYPITLGYETRISPELIISWINRYTVNMPIDRRDSFKGDLATGVSVKNQPDVERMKKDFNYEAWLAYNFKRHWQWGFYCGLTFFRSENVLMGSSLKVQIDRYFNHTKLNVFVDLGKTLVFRPFLALESFKDRGAGDPTTTNPIFGLGIYHWFD